MCLAVPAKIVQLNDSDNGSVDIGGVTREISLIFIDNPKIGDYVIVHAGFAITKLDSAAAKETLMLLED